MCCTLMSGAKLWRMDRKNPRFRKRGGVPSSLRLAAICLLVGLPIGYLLGTSAPEKLPAPSETVAFGVVQGGAGMNEGTQDPAPTMEDMKRMVDKKAEPLFVKLKADPNNAELLNQVGIVYRSAHQFKEAGGYFEKSLQVDPKNVHVRTDMVACMYYNGDVDGALAELQTPLSYDLKHAGTLMNISIIEWKVKNDAAGAVASWEKPLKLNPNFEQRELGQHLINEAQQGSKNRG